nr:MAG TPA: tail protein [Caudoviricetes sp.]
MLKLCSEIIIEGDKTWKFNAVADCKIVEDVSTLTDTCEIQLPKKIKWQEAVGKNGKPPIKRGDKITIRLGYDDDLETRFTGFIRSVDAKVPITIKCEDGMFILKSHKVKPRAFKNASLHEIVSYLLEGTNIKFQLMDKNIKVGNWRLTKTHASEELQELKEKMMLSSYFRTINKESVLYIGLAYPLDNRKKVKFIHSKNIIDEDFEYRDKEDIRVRCEAQSFNGKKKKVTYEYGDKDGDLIKIRMDGLTEAELKKYAIQAVERYKQSGFKGSFETFGQPEVSKCDMVEIHASDGNSGVYLVKKIEIDFGMNGYRQKIELGQPLTINEQ